MSNALQEPGITPAHQQHPQIVFGFSQEVTAHGTPPSIALPLVGHAGNSVTDMSFPPSSEQGRKATRIGYTGSFSNAGLAAIRPKSDQMC
ncbi:MAG: hypothetical protein AB8B97_17855 [Granulosicoccus sp.]